MARVDERTTARSGAADAVSEHGTEQIEERQPEPPPAADGVEPQVDQTVPPEPLPSAEATRPRGWGLRVGILVLVVLAVLGLALASPVLVPDVYTNIVSLAAVYGIVALSLNVLLGHAGQVSLGHAAFFGIGAFGSGYAMSETGLPFGVGLVVAGATGAIGAAVLGAVALRLRGLYLALVTIAYGLFAQETVFNLRDLTGGGAGMPAARPTALTDDVSYAYFCIGMLALALLFDRRLVASRAGRAIQALRDDERVAASWGIGITGYKVLAFVLSGALAGVAGGLFASIEQIVSPQDFTFQLSLTFLLMTVVGGAGYRWGVVQGAIVFAALPTLLDRAHAHLDVWPFTAIDVTWEPAIAALLLLLTLVFTPGGIGEQQARAARALLGRGER